MEDLVQGEKCRQRHTEGGFKGCCFVFIQRDQRTFLTLIASIFAMHPYCASIPPL